MATSCSFFFFSFAFDAWLLAIGEGDLWEAVFGVWTLSRFDLKHEYLSKPGLSLIIFFLKLLITFFS